MELGETTNISFRLKMENGWDGRSSKEILLANRQRLGCPSRGNILQYAHLGRAFFGIIFSFIDNGNMFSREHNIFRFFVGCPFANTKGNSIFPATSDCNDYTVHTFLFVTLSPSYIFSIIQYYFFNGGRWRGDYDHIEV